MAEKKPKHKIENLVVLQYASNICYTNVVKLDIEKLPTGVLSVDPSKGTWRAWHEKVGFANVVNLCIGKDTRRCEDSCRYGVIGVYDCTDVTHLNKMVHDAKEATREKLCYALD